MTTYCARLAGVTDLEIIILADRPRQLVGVVALARLLRVRTEVVDYATGLVIGEIDSDGRWT